MSPYGVIGDNLYFLTNEIEQGERDLDGNGSPYDTVLQVFNVTSGQLQLAPVAVPSLSLEVAIHYEVDGQLVLALPASGESGVLVFGDRDADGTLDAVDLCPDGALGVEAPLDPLQAARRDALQIDADLDGLGDRVCDPGYSPYTPPSPPPFTPAQAVHAGFVSNAALDYLKARVEATRHCLDRLVGSDAGPLADPTALCRGSFVGGVEIRPQDKTARKAFGEAREAFVRKLEGVVDRRFAERLLQTYAESAIATMQVAYGEPQLLAGEKKLQSASRACQERIGTASAEYLVKITGAMQRCLVRRGGGERVEDLAGQCLGKLGEQGLELPKASPTRKGLVEARQGLEELADGCDLSGLDSCLQSLEALQALKLSNDMRPSDCLTATIWRRAVEAVLSPYGPGGIRTYVPLERGVSLWYAVVLAAALVIILAAVFGRRR